ncbi:hypothetical protein AAFF_G00041350 [Aldrovandia affinis]|uniref:Uncharacterized protein n=1 Tax=Aldrovandia affinis TaxID=143900 RepID=A0AAD7S2F9_9TELE|nr:hypothetical protein AAFF_G00041350 [Aldrovandia affinis]
MSDPEPSKRKMVKVIPAATLVPSMSRLLKILLPTQGQNTSVCFLAVVPRVFKLLHDPATGLSVDAEISQGAHFLKIEVRYKDGCHIGANTTGILVTQEGNEKFLPWTAYATSHHCDGITITLQNETLEVSAGNIHLDILWHQNGQNSFLWPAIRQQAPIPNAKGLLGLSPVSYVFKETTPVAKLEILGKEVLATRVSTVDYSTHAKPTVDCWLNEPGVDPPLQL